MARIALFCQDVVGKSMAGPGIRYWEFAKALSKTHDVTLLIPNIPELQSSEFKIVSHGNKLLGGCIENVDIIITQHIRSVMAWHAKRKGIKIILDAYDPLPIESLELYKNLPLQQRIQKNQSSVTNQIFALKMADAVICASEKQKDLWIGSLMALNSLTPQAYDVDPSLKHLIATVPFGLPSSLPIRTGPGLRERFNLQKSDRVILWGGGIWNWFDPLTLIKSIKLLSTRRNDIKLVFMGLKHPNDIVPEMEMSRQAVQLAKDLNLIDKHVFFNYQWVPYNDRQNFLLDADIGVSTHQNHLETRYSFRTRILDYIWAGLPIIGTEGDSFAELIQNNNLGIVVPFNDSNAIAEAIVKILDNQELYNEIQNNLAKMRNRFHWENVIEPFGTIIPYLLSSTTIKIKYRDFLTISKLTLQDLNNIIKRKGLNKFRSIFAGKKV